MGQYKKTNALHCILCLSLCEGVKTAVFWTFLDFLFADCLETCRSGRLGGPDSCFGFFSCLTCIHQFFSHYLAYSSSFLAAIFKKKKKKVKLI